MHRPTTTSSGRLAAPPQKSTPSTSSSIPPQPIYITSKLARKPPPSYAFGDLGSSGVQPSQLPMQPPTQPFKLKPVLKQPSSAPSFQHQTTSSTSSAAAAIDMPPQFVSAMRTLFDIMDDRSTGHVRLADIERRWPTDGTAPGLPLGVIEALRRVAPASGLLSFERFCEGLKASLTQRNPPPQPQQQPASLQVRSPEKPNKPSPPPASKLLPTKANTATTKPLPLRIANNTAAIRPNTSRQLSGGGGGGFPVHRTLSLPKLNEAPRSPGGGSGWAPPKPPRTALVLGNGCTNINHLDPLDKAEIRNALQTWQMGVLANDGTSVRPASGERPPQPSAGRTGGGRGRREPRRHTLQHGVDYNMLKQLKQLEEEKEMLGQGMDAVQTVQVWFERQLQDVQERIRMLGKTSGMASSTSNHMQQEHLHLQRVRIEQISRTLLALTDDTPQHSSSSTSTNGRSTSAHLHHIMHMPTTTVRHTSTGINPPASPGSSASASANTRLQQRVKQLGDEVHDKGQYIAMLERERKTLIRELLHAQRPATSRIGGPPSRPQSMPVAVAGAASQNTITKPQKAAPQQPHQHNHRHSVNNQVNF